MTELKKVLSNSGSGSSSISSVKRRLMLLHSARSIASLAEPLAHVRDGAIDALVVELDALDRIALAAAPVALLEARRRAARDGAELGVVVGEGLNERRGALFDECVAAAGGATGCGHLHHRLRISASPNSLHFTSFAPSIRRAKSYVTVFWPIVLSIAVMIASAASVQPM